MKTITYTAAFEEKAGRWEFIIRIIWAIPSSIIGGALATVAGLALLFQFAHIILYKKRHKALNGLIAACVSYWTKLLSYLLMLTDERSPILPEK